MASALVRMLAHSGLRIPRSLPIFAQSFVAGINGVTLVNICGPCTSYFVEIMPKSQIKSFLLVYEAVKSTLYDQVGLWGYIGRVILV